MRTVRRTAALTFLLLILAPGGAGAFHPLGIETAATVPAGRVAAEFSGAYDDLDGGRATRLDLTLTAGFNPRLDASINFPYLVIDEEGHGTVSGAGDPEVSVKWRLHEGQDLQTLAAKLGVTFPTGVGEEGLGHDKPDVTLTAFFDRALGALTVRWNIGYSWIGAPTGGERDYVWSWAATGEWLVAPRWTLVGGLRGSSSLAEDDLGRASATGGAVWRAGEHLTLDAGLAAGLSEDAPDWGLLAGACFRY